MKNMTRVFRTLPLLLGLALVATACDDPTDVEGHQPAEGVAILHEGEEIFRHMLTDPGTPTLDLDIRAYDIAFVLLDEGGDPIPHEDHEEGEEDELVVTIEDPTVLTWTPEDHAVGGEPEHLEFHGELEALTEGSTTMDLCLLHGTHCDFEATIIVDVAG